MGEQPWAQERGTCHGVAPQRGSAPAAALRSRHPGKCLRLRCDVSNCSHRFYTPSASNSSSPEESPAYFTFLKNR